MISKKETLYNGYAQEFTGTLLLDTQSDFQNIVVLNTPLHGNVMLLDGVVQITEKDEFFYSEMMSHPVLFSVPKQKRILIIGGGDGAIAEECLKHEDVLVTMVEIDQMVINQSAKFFASVNDNVFLKGDPRFKLIVGDGFEFLKNSMETFDVIITDRPDPIGPGALLFQEEFYSLCKARLSDCGIMVFQNGVPFYQMNETVETNNILKKLFPHNGFYFGAVPTYVGGQMAYAWAGNTMIEQNLTRLDEAFINSKVSTMYYSPRIHISSLVCPPYVKAML